MNIRLFKPSVGEEELQAIREAFERSWIGLGPKVEEFEKEWEKFVGCKTAIALNSATAALHLAISCFGFKEGKKILVPSLTFAATATAILYNRLIPVFVDSDPVTLGISLEDLQRKYDSDCVAVMVVHYAGHPAPMDEIMDWARKMNLKVIEDCAHTAGGFYKGKALGTWGDIGCYSFEEKKCMTTGDGGMIVSDNPDLLKNVKAMRWVGIDKDNWKSAGEYVNADQNAMHWFYEIRLLGYKYNMNDLAASIGLVQLKKLSSFNNKRSAIIRQYLNGLAGLSRIKPLLPFQPEEYPYQMFGIRSERRDALMIFLKSKGIATGCHYTPLTLQPLFKKYKNDCSFIESESSKFITLPLHADLKNEAISYVLHYLKEFERI